MESTSPITRTEAGPGGPRAPCRPSPRPRVEALLALSAGLALLAGALGPLVAEIRAVPARAAAAALASEPVPDRQDLMDIVRRSETAARFSDPAGHLQRAALARWALAGLDGLQGPEGRAEATAALALERASLASAPGNPFGWAWLCQVDARLHGISPFSARAWRMSALTGPFDPDLGGLRLRIGLLHWDAFDGDGRAALAAMIRMEAARDPAALAASAVEADATRVVRRILVADPPLLLAFDQGVARYLPPPAR